MLWKNKNVMTDTGVDIFQQRKIREKSNFHILTTF